MLSSKIFRIGLTGLLLLLVGLLLIGSGLHKKVTLVIDGESRSQTSFALTVGGLLRSAQIPLGSADKVQPSINQWLHEGETVVIEHAILVNILADGQNHQVMSADRLPTNLLALANIPFYPGDSLLLEGIPILTDVALSNPKQTIALQVKRAVTFSLQEGDKFQTISTTAATLGQALWQAGIVLSAADHLEPIPGTPLSPGLQAILARASAVTIQTQSGNFILPTAASTVGEALAEAGLALQGLDYSLPTADAPVPADGHIRLVRVLEEVLIEQIPLEFESVYQPVSDLEIDTQSIVQPGEYGLIARRVRVRYEDGMEVSRKVESEWGARQPQNRIVGYGTQIVKHTLDTPDGTIQYWRAYTMWATSYHPAGVGGNITATGQILRKGLVAINTNYIPYGTIMYVPGYGYAEAADTGNIGPRWIDLGYSDDDYVAWHQYVTVYFLWPPPDNIVWIIP